MARFFGSKLRMSLPITWVALSVIAAYLLLFFPLSYFRHDDWLILGNSVLHIPKDWGFTLRPVLFFSEQEVVWFFRPLFKFFVFIFYHLFGYNYYLWLVLLLTVAVGTCWAGHSIVVQLTGSSRWANLFVVLSVASLHIHFGSLIWMGEGMMNIPQLFFLILSTFYFCRSLDDPGWKNALLGLVLYIVSLGFKESGVFHLFFLGLLCLLEPKLKRKGLWGQTKLLMPYVLTTMAYLFYQFFALPPNPAYSMNFQLNSSLKTLSLFATSFLFPFLVFSLLLAWFGRPSVKIFFLSFRRKSAYLLFLGLCIGPYLGLVGFFSPGWLLLPGVYFFLILGLVGGDSGVLLPRRVLSFSGVIILVVSSVVVIYQLNRVQWWRWHQGQRQISEIVSSLPKGKFQELAIVNCTDPILAAEKVGLGRVIGFRASLYQLWSLHHGKPSKIAIHGCGDVPSAFNKKGERRLILRWNFPGFERLT